jgi:hypothetical protein
LCCFGFVVAAFICMLCTFTTYSTSDCCHYKRVYVCMYVCTTIPSVYQNYMLSINFN